MSGERDFDAFYKGIGLERHRKSEDERNSMLLCLFGLFDGFCDGRDVGAADGWPGGPGGKAWGLT